MALSKVASGVALLSCAAVAQQPGTSQPEIHPPLWLQDCDSTSCKWQKGGVVMDANWRWAHKGDQNCYDENMWNSETCADGAACAQSCSLEGGDYAATYGVTTTAFQDGVNLKFVTKGKYSNNYGSRLYVTDSEDTYKIFKLKNREFTFDVDVSSLSCGLNGALYFVEMDRHGDQDGHNNKAGAKYGTGYCDAQCPHDVKWIKGEANVKNWQSQLDPPIGHYGSCCAELDIWEANSRATSFTPHPCSQEGLTKCEGVTCGDNTADQRYKGICDKDGCDYNNYRMGATGLDGALNFYGHGSGFTLDTSKPMTVVTQFITHNGKDTGDLTEIKRFFVQDNKVIENSEAVLLGPGAGNSVTDDFCGKQKKFFDDPDDFKAKGGLKKMGEAMERGMVLVLSLWDDSQVNMLWLDSKYPTDEPAGTPGVMRGPCPGGSASTPAYLRDHVPGASVTYSKIKVSTIGSTNGKGRSLSEKVVPVMVV